MNKVIVIGGGPAGMFAAVKAAENGADVLLLEKNEKLGKKLFITGKGRCNVTNDCEPETFFHSVVSNNKFLYSSYYGFDASAAMLFFENSGVPLKVERGNRVFPVSDHSSDVIKGLERAMKRAGVSIRLNTTVRQILVKENHVTGVKTEREILPCNKVILATGGLSYPITGSTGDGHAFASSCGHTIKDCRPSLVPLETEELWPMQLMGLSLRNVQISVYDGKKKLYDEFGEMLFTHFGVSGPLVLTASCYIGKRLQDHSLQMYIDLKPALDEEQLNKRVLRDFEENQNRVFKNAIKDLFPAKMVPVMVELSGISGDTPVHQITKEAREGFVHLIKKVPLTLLRTREYKEAIITQGGIHVKEVDPGTMESKFVKGLYFAGEVLDLDAVTGGFNLQIAWCTANAAGISAAEQETE